MGCGVGDWWAGLAWLLVVKMLMSVTVMTLVGLAWWRLGGGGVGVMRALALALEMTQPQLGRSWLPCQLYEKWDKGGSGSSPSAMAETGEKECPEPGVVEGEGGGKKEEHAYYKLGKGNKLKPTMFEDELAQEVEEEEEAKKAGVKLVKKKKKKKLRVHPKNPQYDTIPRDLDEDAAFGPEERLDVVVVKKKKKKKLRVHPKNPQYDTLANLKAEDVLGEEELFEDDDNSVTKPTQDLSHDPPDAPTQRHL